MMLFFHAYCLPYERDATLTRIKMMPQKKEQKENLCTIEANKICKVAYFSGRDGVDREEARESRCSLRALLMLSSAHPGMRLTFFCRLC